VTVTAPEKVNIPVKRAGNTIKTKDFMSNFDMLSSLTQKSIARKRKTGRPGWTDQKSLCKLTFLALKCK